MAVQDLLIRFILIQPILLLDRLRGSDFSTCLETGSGLYGTLQAVPKASGKSVDQPFGLVAT